MFRSSSGLAKTMSSAALEIRPFRDADGTRVRELFIEVNRLLSPAELRDAFEAYIAVSYTHLTLPTILRV